MKRIIATILFLCIVFTSIPMEVFANEIGTEESTDETHSIGEVGGYLSANIKTVENLYADRKFTTNNGFGFAAERGNNLIDNIKGSDATVVGDNNVKNGADRMIVNRDGSITWIQDKYYSSASGSVNAAFDDVSGLYRYIDGDGKPMQLEVPSDQYDDAVKIMRDKIEKGLVPGVTNSDEATSLVRKGHLSYKQAVNLAKAGTVESLTYDSVNGAVVATYATGITFAIDYACCILNGLEPEAALKDAGLNGIKSGGVVFATYVISSQIAKTGATNALVPTAEAIAKSLGDDVCRVILERTGINTAGLTAAQVTNNVAKVLSKELIADGVLIVVLTGVDVVELFNGRISKEELLKNLCVTIISIAAGTAGGIGGAALGSLIAPGAGSYIGGIIGSMAGGAAGSILSETVIARFYKSDADQMYEIISAEFLTLCDEYLISVDEGNLLAEELKNVLIGDVLKDMYASEDREIFARELIEPLFVEQVAQREEIVLPTEEELRYEMLASLQGVVFVH